MKNAIKIAFAVAVATAGIAACTSTPEAARNTAAGTPESLPTPTSSSTPSTVVTEITTVTVTNPPEAFVKVDNRLGYGTLKLGMTPEEAAAAGLKGLNWGPAGAATCTGAENVAISRKYGIERITLPADAKTSKGIGVGSTVADVKKAYSNAKEHRTGLSTSLNDTGGYSFSTYGYADTDKIVEIKLVSSQTDCALAAL
ncbi:hypothetical protein SK803_18425 [Lentzea sp. BCCO 10_0856]|uniref:CAP domain-containing protein n=1 Tax=Lentzea miocenica TaxID=3095431 RepID=A0ABU4T297_9PSEU|nr:hypothetical protein [Lentzea sp. BCCO 10_0856]MDX8032199.1 hypothetical protein [Lentzea sp. BCCO 10_0856]